MANAPFPVNPELTAIALAYRNAGYIADAVLPRFQVGTQEFKYWKYDLGEGFRIPDTKVGRRSAPAEIEFSATEQTASTDDYGLEDPIPQSDIENAPAGRDPRGRATESLTDLIMLDREKRVADIVFAAATYPAANKTTLSGTSQWSDFTNSNPIDAILAALDGVVMRPNVMVVGRATWTKLIQHPKIVKATYGDATDAGVARKRDVAELFELEEILVGESWLNTAKKGQAVTMGRVWGKHCALLYRDRLAATTAGRITFGLTAEWQTRVSGSMPDPKIGLRGGERVRVGESVKELVTASDVGYFFENAVA